MRGAHKSLRQRVVPTDARNIVPDQCKFVTTQAGNDIAFAQSFPQTPGDAFEERITHGVSMGVVNLFEMVEIQKMDCEALPAFEGPLQLFPKRMEAESPERQETAPIEPVAAVNLSSAEA